MDMMEHANHILQFDGVLHWCIQIAIAGFIIGGLWVVLRVLIPLRRLVKEASVMLDVHAGALPTFDSPSSGIHEIEQLRRALQAMLGQIQAAQSREQMYRTALTESQENERKRIAREIHDDTIQSLVVVSHEIARAGLAAKASGATTEHLENARTQLLQTIDNLRQLIGDLRPTMLDELGLAVALEALCEKHPTLEFEVVGEAVAINHAQELAIFRAAQETIHNAESHARASRIVARLVYSDREISLEVCDNGIGFPVPPQLQEFALRGHYGLLGLRERSQHLGGCLSLISEAAAGTVVRVTLPILPAA